MNHWRLEYHSWTGPYFGIHYLPIHSTSYPSMILLGENTAHLVLGGCNNFCSIYFYLLRSPLSCNSMFFFGICQRISEIICSSCLCRIQSEKFRDHADDWSSWRRPCWSPHLSSESVCFGSARINTNTACLLKLVEIQLWSNWLQKTSTHGTSLLVIILVVKTYLD